MKIWSTDYLLSTPGMRAICLKQVLFGSNYSNILAWKVEIWPFRYENIKNISKTLQKRLTRMCNLQTRTSKVCIPCSWIQRNLKVLKGYPLYNTLQLSKGRGFTFNMMEILIVQSSHLHSGLWICSILPYGYFINWFTQTVLTRILTTVKLRSLVRLDLN